MSVKMTVTRLMSEAKSEKDIAVKIFRFVRDIRFGFASNFYSQTADEVISQNRGFALPKANYLSPCSSRPGFKRRCTMPFSTKTFYEDSWDVDRLDWIMALPG